MNFLLSSILILVIIWFLPRWNLISNAGFNEARLLLIFKVIISLACAFYFEDISASSDYTSFNEAGKIQQQLLLNDPVKFLAQIFIAEDSISSRGLFKASESFWAYLSFNLIYAFLSVLNIITQGNFYLNTAIFSSIVFVAHLTFYRIYHEIYGGNKYKILLITSFLPSLLLYTSCVHKDGLVFICLALVSFFLHRVFNGINKPGWKLWLGMLLGLTGIFLFRNYVLVALFPAAAVALSVRYLPYKPWKVISVCYLLVACIFFISGYKESPLNLPEAVAERKIDFAALDSGTTTITMHPLKPTVRNFAANLPQAINHSMMRPYTWEYSQPAIILTALELLLYQVIFLCFILFRKRDLLPANHFNLFGIAFFLTMMLIIGYTIPNIGAIVRYRSIFWLFVLCPMVCNTDWKRLTSVVIRNK